MVFNGQRRVATSLMLLLSDWGKEENACGSKRTEFLCVKG